MTAELITETETADLGIDIDESEEAVVIIGSGPPAFRAGDHRGATRPAPAVQCMNIRHMA